MKSMIRKLRIKALKAQLEAIRLECEAFAAEFGAVTTVADRRALAHAWDAITKAKVAAQIMLELLEEQDEDADSGPATHS